jgi:hypothetical protein
MTRSSPGIERDPEVVAAVQEALMRHPFWKPGLGSSAFAFGLANTAIDAYTKAIEARAVAAEVQDTYLVGGPDLKAMSGSVESDRVIQLHFSRKATDADRAWLLEAINAKKAADKAGVGDVAQAKLDPVPTAWLVDGPAPLDSSEVFLTHDKALEAFNDWGKRITPLYAFPSTEGK